MEFCIANKVNYIINSCGKQCTNHWTAIGIAYLTLNWRDTDDQSILDAKGQNVTKAIRFIETALQKGDSVLVHSMKGQNRSCCVVVAYLIHKYRWTLTKSMEFLKIRRKDANIKMGMLKQLREFEESVRNKSLGGLSEKWTGFIIFI